MSTIIRMQLKLAVAAMRSLSDEANVALGQPNPTIPVLGAIAEKLERKIAQGQEMLNNWTKIMVSASEKEVREEEEAIFAGFEVNGETPVAVIAAAQDRLAEVEIKVVLLKAEAEDTKPLPASSGSSSPTAHPMVPKINLPALQLPDFDGNVNGWFSFWAAFEHAIHQNSGLTGSQKLTYLVGRLRGSARVLVEGFALTDGNYPIVVDLLKGRYGDENKRADQLRSELFHLPKPSGRTDSIRSFAENVDRICRQLEALGTNMDDNPFLTVAIKEKLPTEVKAQLYDKEMEEKKKWTSKEWRERLHRVVRVQEAVNAPWENPRPLPAPPAPRHANCPPEVVKRAFPVVQNGRTNFSDAMCFLCGSNGHRHFHCPSYPNSARRRARLAELGRCTLCARSGHKAANCTSSALCLGCKGKHMFLVCPERDPKPVASGGNAVPLISWPSQQYHPTPNFAANRRQYRTEPTATAEETKEATAQLSGAMVKCGMDAGKCNTRDEGSNVGKGRTYLMVSEVPVFNHLDPDRPILAAVFFDTGSQPSFVTEKLVAVVAPEVVGREQMAVGGFLGGMEHNVSHFSSPRHVFHLQRADGGWEKTELNQTRKIVPSVDFLREIPPYTKSGMQLEAAKAEPQILLGIGQFWRFFLGLEEVNPGIFRIDTVFGAVYCGKVEHLLPPHLPNPSVHVHSVFPLVCGTVVKKATPDQLVRQIWSLESIGITDSPAIKEEELAIASFDESIRFVDGRYEVRWPWRPTGKAQLGNNFNLAYSRLASLSGRLRANPEFSKRYCEVIADQLARGIIEEAERTHGFEHFIPHQAVVNTKKIRVVYDASSHEKGKISLNEALIPGPNLVPELAGILVRFRATPIPVLGDIEKAFLTVGLHPEDREVAKFLWLRDPALPLTPDNLAIFRFTRIAFGVNSSPFLLASVIQHHLGQGGDPLGIKTNFYVDNLLLCNENAEQAAASVRAAREIMGQAGMRLREFVAADHNVLAGLSPDDVLSGGAQKVLGVNWDIEKEEIMFKFPKAEEYPATRRGVLGAIASLFDPLGLCSPCMLKAKAFFQTLWDTGRGWDEPLGEDERTTWKRLTEEWAQATMCFPRLTPCSGAKLQLHVFSDAGPEAYAMAAYLRAEWDGRVEVSLLFAKSRVRPKKMSQEDGLTIPRLELLGLLVAVRARRFLLAQFPYQVEKTVFWCDSQIVLSWLEGSEKHPMFVANRLREIKREAGSTFRYVPSLENPADYGARGASPGELRGAYLWRCGPIWLRYPSSRWPSAFREVVIQPEEADQHPIVSAAVDVDDVSWVPDPAKYSSWKKLVAVTKFVLFFVAKKLEKSRIAEHRMPWLVELANAVPQSAEAANVAVKYILRNGQNELEASLRAGAARGPDGLWRLMTRLGNADQPIDFRKPVLLPRNSPVTQLLVRAAHTRLAHAGVESTLCEFLARVWCPRARRLVKGIIKECATCKRDRAVPFKLPNMPPWPPSRVRPSPPFTFTCLDYLGPTLFVGEGGEKRNAWVLLLTCLSTRCVHLEVVCSMDSVEFLQALRRFVARRGQPKEILSDNAGQFTLTKEVLDAYSDIRWRMTPPLSPWSGGVYERLVGLVKTAFRRAVGRKVLPLGTLITVITEIEAVLNCRPISPVADGADAPAALRPVDFLIPLAQTVWPEPPWDDADPHFRPTPAEKLTAQWHSSAQAVQAFWEKWSVEYLLMLRERTQTKHRAPRCTVPDFPHKNQIVLVENDRFPRNLWPLGRIVEVDRRGANAKVLMGNGNIWGRPVCKLAPLEAAFGDEREEEEQGNATPPPLPIEAGPEERQSILPMPPTSDVGARKECEWMDCRPHQQQQTEGRHELLASNEMDHTQASSPPRDDHQPSEQSRSAALEVPAASKEGRRGRRMDGGEANVVPPKVKWALRSRGKIQLTGAVWTHPFCLMLLAVLLLAIGAIAAPRMLSCDAKGIWVNFPPHAKETTVCCEGICSGRASVGPYLLPLPRDLLVTGFECHASYTAVTERVNRNIHCEPVEGCMLIDCVLCADRFMNPHCFPFFSATAVGLGAAAVVVTAILFIMLVRALCMRRRQICCPLCLGSIRNRIGRRLGRREEEGAVEFRRAGPVIQEVDSSDSDEVIFHRPVNRSLSPRNGPPMDFPRSRPRMRASPLERALSPLARAILIVALAASGCVPCNAGIEVLPVTADAEQCTTSEVGTECHFDSVTSVTLLPAGQQVEMVARSPHSAPMGSLFFTMKKLELTCIKVNRAWLRSHELGVSSVFRCPAAGSCSGTFCAMLQPNQTVPELDQTLPGNNFCREASGFITRGCFFPEYGCLFYRVHAVPASPFVYELFECPQWQPKLSLGIAMETGGRKTETEMKLVPGIAEKWRGGNLTVEFSPFGIPPLPVLGQKFLSNGTHAAIGDGTPTHLRCANQMAAKHFDCTLDRACQCHTHHGAGHVACNCPAGNLEAQVNDPASRLPLSTRAMEVRMQKGVVVTSLPFTPVNLIVRMDRTRLAVGHSQTRCSVNAGSLRGCFSCLTGGRFNFSCSADHGETLASIFCADGTGWVSRCAPGGTNDSVVLSWSRAQVDTECTVDCGGERTSFVLAGRLMFFQSSYGKSKFVEAGGEESWAGVGGMNITFPTFPHVKFALFNSVGSLPQAMIALASVTISLAILFLAIRFCPLSILLGFCCPTPVAAAAMAAEATSDRHRPDGNNRARTM